MNSNATKNEKNKLLTEFILIVDDEEDIRDLLVDQIQLSGFKAVTAANGSEALAKLRDNSCFLVLSDYLVLVRHSIQIHRVFLDKFLDHC